MLVVAIATIVTKKKKGGGRKYSHVQRVVTVRQQCASGKKGERRKTS